MSQRDAARATSTRSAASATPQAETLGARGAPSGAEPDRPRPDAAPGGRPDLSPGASPSLWWVLAGIAAAVTVTVSVGVTQGAAVLSGLLALSALARAVLRPGPVALTVRSRVLDCAVLAGLALGVALLSQLAPTA